MRVQVPGDTDLNHYFEIMNNRGEQLEKHEILKSRMMNTLKSDEKSQNCLNLAWEACANMEQYVQMGFSKKQREAIFGAKDWNNFNINSFDALREKITKASDNSSSNESELELNEIIEQAINDNNKDENENDEAPERFNSVINFPNFLLQVLRVQTEQDIPLDDKRLVHTFDANILKKDDAAKKVKIFIFNLLRCKFLYDQYIIKREFVNQEDGWSLKRLSKNGSNKVSYKNTFGDDGDNESDNKKILMLLSAFHVSTPTLTYKHWLNAALHYLFITETVIADMYLKHLESVAKAFVFDRFLSADDGLDYFDIVFKNTGACQTTKKAALKNNIEEQLAFREIKNNLVFNFLDYLLWLDYRTDDIVENYKFKFHSSVEHYYPQNPSRKEDKLSSDILHSFGNLCLISNSKNSRLSNFMPVAKKEYYQNNKIDSVKQHLMMKYREWNEDSIRQHFDKMEAILLNKLSD